MAVWLSYCPFHPQMIPRTARQTGSGSRSSTSARPAPKAGSPSTKRRSYTWAADVDSIYDTSAQETGGHRHLRYITTADCQVDVRGQQQRAPLEQGPGTASTTTT